jgi:hypothetical protein
LIRKAKRQTEGFNLAFLDIMSCGLGAIVLVFLLVKHNVDTAVPENDLLEKGLARLEQEASGLRKSISDVKTNHNKTALEIQKTSLKLEQLKKAGAGRAAEKLKLQKQLSALKEKIKNTEVAKVADVVKNPNIGEENYVIGLKVEGRKIAILIDSSSSMTDEILIDIIRRKNGNDTEKKAGPKWQRTKSIVKWLLARLPANSSVSVSSFSNKSRNLGPQGWQPSKDQSALNAILKDMEALVPEGPTNLEAGLKSLVKKNPTNIYFITDGLPTKGESNYKSLNPFASCSSLSGSSNKISGPCREQLFRHTIKSSAPPISVPINIILLPIEGDPTASTIMWSWTSVTGGTLISPAESWP